jgi:hypothetical protein
LIILNVILFQVVNETLNTYCYGCCGNLHKGSLVVTVLICASSKEHFELSNKAKENDGNTMHRGAIKSLAQPGRKQARKHVRDARDFNNIETRAAFKFVFLQGKVPKEIHTILTETLACVLPNRANDLSAPL